MVKMFYINHKLLDRIERKTQELLSKHKGSPVQEWQLQAMVGAIESGFTTETFYFGDTIIVAGWNGYHNYDNNDGFQDVYRAWGGFYRMEPAQMMGELFKNLIALRKQGKEITQEYIYRCTNLWALYKFAFLQWEEVENVYGYTFSHEFYEEEDARKWYEKERKEKGFVRGSAWLHEWSGMWVARVETTRKPDKNAIRTRIAK